MTENERKQADKSADKNPEAPVRRPTAERMEAPADGKKTDSSAAEKATGVKAKAGGKKKAGAAKAPAAKAPAPGQAAKPGQAPKPGQPQSAGQPQGAKRPVGIRQIHMTVSKIDPLSALKLGFLVSVAIGLMVVVAMMLVWFLLDGMHVFSQINTLLSTLGSQQLLQVAEYLEFGRWMSFAVIVAILDIVLLTALSAVGAVIYNLIASLVGGVKINVTDE